MKCTNLEYTQHFSKFSERLFQLHPECHLDMLSPSEHFLLKVYGLPDCGLPFFRFDLSLQYLRDIQLPNCLFVLGCPMSSSSNEFIFIAQDHTIQVMDEDGLVYFLNSSLSQLMNCIYLYSKWLEDIERTSTLTSSPVVNNEDVFNIYYHLRQEDNKALYANSIWHEIVHTEMKLPVSAPEYV